MKKVLLTATVQSHIAQFHKPLINMLKENGYEVHVAARDNLEEKNGLQLNEPDKVFNIPFDRSPLSKSNVIAYKQLKQIINNTSYDIIHCNTPMGGVITRLAAKKARKKGSKVFYTAHGFHFYKGAPKINWMIYYPIEKWFARYTDKLITINKEDYNTALKKKFKTKIEHIHGVGANTDKYFLPTSELKKNLRIEEGYNQDDFICICTGELNNNKNQIVVLEAVSLLIARIPTLRLILAGNGPNYDYLQEAINNMNLNKHVKMIGYVTDLERYVMMSDIVISASIREGLPLNIIEAMICGKPVVASLNRGHRELVHDKKNGFLIDSLEGEDFAKAIKELYCNEEIRINMGKKSRMDSSKYMQEYVLLELEEIYKI